MRGADAAVELCALERVGTGGPQEGRAAFRPAGLAVAFCSAALLLAGSCAQNSAVFDDGPRRMAGLRPPRSAYDPARGPCRPGRRPSKRIDTAFEESRRRRRNKNAWPRRASRRSSRKLANLLKPNAIGRPGSFEGKDPLHDACKSPRTTRRFYAKLAALERGERAEPVRSCISATATSPPIPSRAASDPACSPVSATQAAVRSFPSGVFAYAAADQLR